MSGLYCSSLYFSVASGGPHRAHKGQVLGSVPYPRQCLPTTTQEGMCVAGGDPLLARCQLMFAPYFAPVPMLIEISWLRVGSQASQTCPPNQERAEPRRLHPPIFRREHHKQRPTVNWPLFLGPWRGSCAACARGAQGRFPSWNVCMHPDPLDRRTWVPYVPIGRGWAVA